MYDYQVSLPAYHEAQVKINEKQQRVLQIIKGFTTFKGKVNDAEIAEKLGWPINRVTPRRGELLEAGVVESAGKHLDPITKRTVNYWRVK